MGQKSNVVTLRPLEKPVDFNITLTNTKNLVKFFYFISSLKNLLRLKNIILLKNTLDFNNNQLCICITLFYKSSKLCYLRRRLKKNIISFFEKKSKLNTLIFDYFSVQQASLIFFSFKQINRFVNEEIVRFIYSRIKRFKNTIFVRRFNLFIDFIKLTALFCEQNVSVKEYLQILSEIFRFLSKKHHNRFFFFIKFIFDILIFKIKFAKIEKIKSFISGIKFQINGKIRGKLRSSSRIVSVGSIMAQKIDSKIFFAKTPAHTLWGVFGLQIWVSFI